MEFPPKPIALDCDHLPQHRKERRGLSERKAVLDRSTASKGTFLITCRSPAFAFSDSPPNRVPTVMNRLIAASSTCAPDQSRRGMLIC